MWSHRRAGGVRGLLVTESGPSVGGSCAGVSATARNRMDECLHRRLPGTGAVRSELVSVVRYGSVERGDFVPGVSDVDFFVVVRDSETVVPVVETVLRECCEHLDHRGVDVAWEYRENLGDPDAGVPFKFLTVYREDFLQHHSVVYGADVTGEIAPVELAARLPARIERVRRLAAERSDDRRALRLLAGETARLRAVLEGADSLAKDDVLAALEAAGRRRARRLYEAYVSGDPVEWSADALRAFVNAETAAIGVEDA